MKYFNFKCLIFFFALAMAIPPAWAEEVTVCDGLTTTEYLPVYGYYFDWSQHNQMIYPASELQDLPSGAFINSITFYPTSALGFSGATVTFSMANAEAGTVQFSTNAYGSATGPLDVNVTQVASLLPTSVSPWTITFDEPFEYTGGDLIIDVVNGEGSDVRTYFTAKDVAANYGYYSYGSYTKTLISKLPKVTFDYDAEAKPYAAKATPSRLAFSKLLPNGEETLNITLKNTGANPITPTLSGLSAPFSTTYTPAQLAAGAEVTIPIKFNPTAVGSYNATLTIGATESNEVAAQVTMTGLCSTDITIEDGTDESGYLPLYYPSYFTQQNQMIYPASDLTALVGKSITGLTFYSAGMTFNGTYNVSVGTTDQTSYASATAIEGLTQVVTGHTATTGVTEFAITFDNPFEYTGGNLVIQMEVTDIGTSAYTQSVFYGTNQSTNTGYYKYNASYGTYSYTRTFLPKVTFGYEDNVSTTASITVSPDEQTINDATAGTYTVTGTNVDGSINVSLATNTDWTVNPQTLSNTGGEVNIAYTGRALSATNTVTAEAANDNTVTASATVNYVADLYIVTDNGQTDNWDFTNGSHMTNNNGTYTASFTANVGNTFILFARKLGDGVTWNTRYVFGPSSNGDWWLTGDSGEGTIDTNNDNPIKIVNSGTYNITINSDGTFTITKEPDQVISGTVTPSTVTMNAEVGTPATATVTIENTGNTAFTPTLTLTDANNVYSISAAEEIAAGESKTVAITFNPAAAGTFAATLAVDINGNITNVTINGTATQSVTPGGNGELTVCDGEATNGNIPVWGAYYNNKSRNQSQMIYPSTMLTSLVGKEITGLKFYTSGNIAFSGGSLDISIGTTTTSQVGWSRITGLTQVVSGLSATSGGTEWEITFAEPFLYEGNNIIIDFELKTNGTAGATTFVGEEQSYASYYTGANGTVRQSFLPKVTFIYGGGAPEPTATASPAALNFGNVVVNTTSAAQTVTLTNTGEVAFTPAFTLTDGFATTATPSEIAVGGSMQIPVTFTPTQEGEYNGTLTISSGTRGVLATVELTGTGVDQLPDYAVTVSPNGGAINFGTVDPEENATSTRTITVTNTGLQPVTPTLSTLSAPFSTDYTAAPLAAGESVTITITFTPTTENDFSANATLSFGNGIADREFTLTGKGGKYDENDHSAIYDMTYDWTDDNGTSHTSNLLETATDPNQIIAMLRKIYMTKEIPGNLYRGYDANGNLEKDKNGNDWQVTYPAIGQIAQTYTSGSGYSYSYSDAYGWNIPTEKGIQSGQLGNYMYKYFDSYEYQPNQDGLTIIMIEMNDNPEGGDLTDAYSSMLGETNSEMSVMTTDYASLHDMFKHLFKSARIITTYKETGTDAARNAGTLFKIDANKLNRFFFLAKGRLRAGDCSAQNPGEDWMANGDPSLSGNKENSLSFKYSFNRAPFYNMFEQFSPVNLTEGTVSSDIYQEMINMQSYPVEHDCQSIPFIKLKSSITIDGVTYGYGHEFNMYGKDSQSDDCQDVRDMMFFVPKYRMMQHYKAEYATVSERDDSKYDMFVNYHQTDSGATEKYAPTLGLYVIHQNEITGDKQANANVYDLNLSWISNLLDFLPGAEAQYQLFRVTIDQYGIKQYTWVATLDPNVTTYVDHVPMQATGQEVTYVVQGQDVTQFLSLQMSNEESFIIPGTDETLLLTLKLANDYSRFDPKEERNYYSNELVVTNNMAPYVTDADLQANGAQFNVYRYSGEENTANEVKTLIATLTPAAGQMLNITWANQRGNGTDAGNYYSWINMPNKSNVAYTVNNNAVAFDNFRLFDNFYESVAQNDHPTQYRYQVEFTYGENTAHSNKVSVYIHKTDMNVQGFTKKNIDEDDLNHGLKANVRYIDELLKYSSKQDILRYDVYRWKENSENERKIMTNSTIAAAGDSYTVTDTEVTPTGEADNGDDEYTLKIDGTEQGHVDIEMGSTATATFTDNKVNTEAGLYYYAPVVETFNGANRTDYNTYGAPVQRTGVAQIESNVASAIMSSTADGGSNWTENGKVYTHYTVTLNLSKLLIPMSQNDALKDYDLYKVRVWRQIDTDLLNEQVYTASNRLGYNRAERITGDFLMEEVNNDDNPEAALGRDGVNNTAGTSAYTLGSRDDLETFHSNWTQTGTDEVMGTFGAQKLAEEEGEAGCITELPMHFIVRAYYTRTANLDQTSGHRGIDAAADQKYYIAEYQFDYTLDSENIVTGISSVIQERTVDSVTYYNTMGQQSSTPFHGVNIVVTRYSDGKISTAKVLK